MLQADRSLPSDLPKEFRSGLAVVAHELRNPLTPIRMAASLLELAGSDQALLLHLRTVIERQVEHMSRLVGDLLDVSRVATGKLRIEPGKADPVDFVNAAVDACQSSLDARGQRLGVELPAAVPVLRGDPVRLTQVVSNLLDNASKFTPRGGTIGLSVSVQPHAVAITVLDNGIGLTADEQQGLFEPFVQSPRATRFHGGGLGIGLSMVRELVEAHGGTVVARSAGKGLGSQFVVTLPLDPAGSRARLRLLTPAGADAAPAANAPTPGESRRTGRMRERCYPRIE